MIALIVPLLWDFVQGRPGRPVDLVTGNGGVMGLKIRAIDRSDLYNFMGFCKADRGDQSTGFMRDNFETFKT